MRMKRKGGNNVIGIRVAPVSGTGCIVDRQQLDDLHTGGFCPVDETPQITEVTHTKGMGATQREHGHHHTGSPPRTFLHTETLTIKHHHGTIPELRVRGRESDIQFHPTVVAFLPGHQFIGLVVDDHIFIFQRQQDGIDIRREHPLTLAQVFHPQITGGIPVA